MPVAPRNLGPQLANAVLALWLLGCAELGLDAGTLGGILEGTRGQGSGPSESVVASGLKQALQIGAERSVARTSREGGFLDDPLLHIALPEELEPMARALRSVGLGAQVDALELAMNRAAERAAAEATPIFWDAVSSMSVSDAYAVLNGPDDAATAYFRAHTEDALRARFAPVVESAMHRVGLYRAYDALLARYRVLSLLSNPAVELNGYVTNEALDGLFSALAREEERIRNDPVARSTELLRRVFGP